MDHSDKSHGACCSRPSSNRRRFLTLAALGAGVSLLSPILPRAAAAAGKADVLLLSCMDFRLLDEVVAYMASRRLTNEYDHFILAGASLGALTDKQPDWGKSFWEHVDVAKSLHHIRKIIVLDHRDCGAYKVFTGIDYGKDPAAETAVHTENLRKLGVLIKRKHPDLEVELLLMDLDGKVAAIAA